MAGLFSRLKTWIQDEKLLYSDQNAEFDNMISNFELQKVKGHSDSVAQMRLTENPGSQGSESTGTAISGADEIERIRYVISRMIGGTYWYDTPPASITQLNTALDVGGSVPLNRITSGRVNADNQPIFLVPAGTGTTCTVKGATTNLAYLVNGTGYTLASDVVSPALTLGAGNTTTLSANAGAYDTEISINAAGAGFTAGTYGAFKNDTSGEIFFGYMQSTTQIARCMRGIFFDSADAVNASAAQTSGQTLTELRVNWVFLKNDSTVDFCSTMPSYAATAPSAPTAGDYWFDFATGLWKEYNGASWAASDAVLLGIAACDGTNCIAARSFDFFRNFSDINEISLEKYSNSVLRTAGVGYQVSVYGSVYRSQAGKKSWDITTDLDSGSEASSTTYYVYVKDTGVSALSVTKPLDRTFDLRGWYHPSKPWRCVGSVANDGSSNFGYPTCLMSPPAASADSGAFSTSSITPAVVTNCTKTIKTNGGLVHVRLRSGSSGAITLTGNATSDLYVGISRNGTEIEYFEFRHDVGESPLSVSLTIPPSCINAWDNPPPGMNTYSVYASTSGNASLTACHLEVFEIPGIKG